MDDSIAPSGDGSDPIADYRRYLEMNTGDRLQTAPAPDEDQNTPQPGAGPDIAPPEGSQASGAGPMIDDQPPEGQPESAPSAPQDAQGSGPVIAPSGGGALDATPTLDAAMPNPLAAPQAPLAPDAPEAKKATKAAKARAARQAAQAPVIAPPQGDSTEPGSGVGMPAPPAGGPQSGPQTDAITSDPSQMTPASGHVIPGKKNAQGKPMVSVVPPDHDPDKMWPDEDSLRGVQTPADLVKAADPKEMDKYMDWWQQQHGDIDTRYNAMLQDMGQRPDPNREPTTKEKFTELMQFGLSLLQNAKRGNDPMAAMGASAQSALAGQQAKQQAQTSDYDKRVAAIQANRIADQKDIGTYGSAVRQDALIQNAITQRLKAQQPPRPLEPATRYDTKGNMYTWKPTPDDPKTMDWFDQDGNRLKAGTSMLPTNAKGNAAGADRSKWGQVQSMVGAGADLNEAVKTVYGSQKQANPQGTYLKIRHDAIASEGKTDAEATTEAEMGTAALHGANWRNAPPVQPRPLFTPKPPAVAPPIGKIGTDSAGYRWRNDGSGKPVLVTQ